MRKKEECECVYWRRWGGRRERGRRAKDEEEEEGEVYRTL